MWTPWSLPIVGAYNGYGRVVGPIPNWHFNLLRERLGEDAVEDTSSLQDFVELQEMVKRGRLQVRATIGTEVVPMGLCFLREDVYSSLVGTPVYSTSVLTAKTQIDRVLADLQGTQTSLLHTGELDDTLRMLQHTEVGDTLRQTLASLKTYRRLTEATGSYGPPGYRGVGAYRLRVAEWIMKGMSQTHPDVLSAGTELGTFLHFLLHFEQLRLLWGPQAGMGSQTTGWESHLTIGRLVRDVAMREFEAETGAYEDPETDI